MAVVMGTGYQICDYGIEQPYGYRPRIPFNPFVIDIAKKPPPLFSGNREWDRPALDIEFHTGDILMVEEAGIPEIRVYFFGSVDIGIGDERQDIEFCVITPQAFQAPNHRCVGPFADSFFSIIIMDIRGSVKADTYQKFRIGQEL